MKKTISVSGETMAYRISGTGPALVLLHGFMESSALWDDFTETLKNEFTVIRIDLPGHGDSECYSDGVHSMKRMAEVVFQVVVNENAFPAVVAGHSMGGYVALRFAADYPDMLQGLVLFHSHAAADSEETRKNRQRTIDVVKQDKTGFIRLFIPDLFDAGHVHEYSDAITRLQELASAMDPCGITAALAGMRDREDMTEFLSDFQQPLLFIIGRNDSRMPAVQLLAQAGLPPFGETLLLEDVGHMGFIEAPEKTLMSVRDFTRRCFPVTADDPVQSVE
jgi:pimeloyl-ACP methyl ester carboxylesterase